MEQFIGFWLDFFTQLAEVLPAIVIAAIVYLLTRWLLPRFLRWLSERR